MIASSRPKCYEMCVPDTVHWLVLLLVLDSHLELVEDHRMLESIVHARKTQSTLGP
jgi:hypothetical protein